MYEQEISLVFMQNCRTVLERIRMRFNIIFEALFNSCVLLQFRILNLYFLIATFGNRLSPIQLILPICKNIIHVITALNLS